MKIKIFLIKALNNFTIEDTKNLFLSLGLPLIELENGKMYPKSLQASSVVDIFRMALEDRKIPLYKIAKLNLSTKKRNLIYLQIMKNLMVFRVKNFLVVVGKSALKQVQMVWT